MIHPCMANLRKVAATCKFGAFLKDALRNRFVCGIKSGELHDRMSNVAHTKELTLAHAYAMGLAHKVPKQNSQQWPNKSFKPLPSLRRKQRQERRRTGGHVIDATRRGTHQRGAALRRWNAGHVKRNDTSPRLSDPDQKEGKTSRPNRPSRRKTRNG